MKRMSRFQRSALITPDEADAHYDQIHHAFGRYFLGQSPAVVRYVTHRVVAQYDINRGFAQPPDAWRFVLTQNEDVPGGATGWLPAGLAAQVWTDHTRFLRDLRSFEVDEQIVADRRSGQMTLAKYVFWSERTGERADHAAFATALGGELGTARGFRLHVSNRVLRELESEAIDEPAQKFTGAYLAATEFAGIEEIWFDNADSAAEFFAEPTARHLASAAGLELHGYFVVEQTGLDRR